MGVDEYGAIAYTLSTDNFRRSARPRGELFTGAITYTFSRFG